MSPALAVDFSKWLTEAQAAAMLKVAPRSIRRMCQEGRGPQSAKRTVAGRRSERVYDPADVERIASRSGALQPAALIAVPATVSRVPALPAAAHGALAITGADMLDYFAASVRRLTEAFPPAAIRAWMTLDEAAEYSGLSRTFLERLVRNKLLPHVRDRAIKVSRADVDAIREGRGFSSLLNRALPDGDVPLFAGLPTPRRGLGQLNQTDDKAKSGQKGRKKSPDRPRASR